MTHSIRELSREGVNAMGYVPGPKQDLFYSCAHGDDPAWIEAFQRSLCQGLEERLGSRVSVFVTSTHAVLRARIDGIVSRRFGNARLEALPQFLQRRDRYQ